MFGKEYYFGGGAQAETHAHFVASRGGIGPVQMIPMGATEIPKEIFEEYLSEITPRFTAETYDLLANNCNNFSDVVCNFLVGRNAPAEITSLPQKVMATTARRGTIRLH